MIGSGCVTMNMFSVTPATASRLNVTRGFGHRPAASASARATSTAARIARTRGLSADSRASASASERTVWAAAAWADRPAPQPRTTCVSAYDSFKTDGYRDGGSAEPRYMAGKEGGARGGRWGARRPVNQDVDVGETAARKEPAEVVLSTR